MFNPEQEIKKLEIDAKALCAACPHMKALKDGDIDAEQFTSCCAYKCKQLNPDTTPYKAQLAVQLVHYLEKTQEMESKNQELLDLINQNAELQDKLKERDDRLAKWGGHGKVATALKKNIVAVYTLYCDRYKGYEICEALQISMPTYTKIKNTALEIKKSQKNGQKPAIVAAQFNLPEEIIEKIFSIDPRKGVPAQKT